MRPLFVASIVVAVRDDAPEAGELGDVACVRRRYRDAVHSQCQEFALGDAATAALELDATIASVALVLTLSTARTEKRNRKTRMFIMECVSGPVQPTLKLL